MKKDKEKKEKIWRSNSKVRFNDKKKVRRSRAYITKEKSLDFKEECNDVYVNSNDDKIIYYISIE